MDWIQEANKQKEAYTEILTFDQYLKIFSENGLRECRTSSKYFKDMFDYFGRTHDGHFQLFLRSTPNSGPVFGQFRSQHEMYQNLINFVEEGFNNKFLLLVGPNGSAKTSLIKKIMEAAEDYSKIPEGALYTFSWIFPIDQFIKGTLGLQSKTTTNDLPSYANLQDKDISSILNAELKDHPLLLIPLYYRRKIIDASLKNHPEDLELIKKSYLYNGDISKRNRMIFDALLQNYQGDYQEVLKHIRVERFIISKRYSASAVTIEPQLHVDLRLQQITMDRRLNSLPPGLQSLNLFSLQGENVMANRGILEFSDLLKRPLDAFKYLLMTMETKTINLQGILTELDIVFVGTSNEIHLSAFKQHPDYHSFRGRMNFIRVPYLLNYQEEIKIYQDQIFSLKEKSNFEPHALETLCLWSVMTRIRPCMPKNFKDKKMAELVATLNPLEKCMLLADGPLPKRLSSEERKIIRSGLEAIVNEFANETLYEGKFGISPREIKQIIYELGSQYHFITFIEILDYLDKFIDRKNEYDFLNIAPQADFNNPPRFISLLKDFQLDNLDQQLRDCLGLIDDRSYEEYISRYIMNVNSLIKGEKIKNNITGRFEEVETFFIREFEGNIKLQENPETFRSHMISTLGAYALDHPTHKKIIYTEVFPDIVKVLKESFREEQKKVILNLAKNLVFYIDEKEIGHEKTSGLSEEGRVQIESVLNNLQKNYHYSSIGSISMVKYLIKERY